MKEENINIFLNSRKFTVAILCIAIIATFLNFMVGVIEPIKSSYGLSFPSSNLWISSPLISLILNDVVIIGIALMLMLLNKSFNFIRGDNWIFISMSLLIICCIPGLSAQLHDGTMMCFITLVCTFLLFSVYQEPSNTRMIYLIFALLTGSGLFQYAYLSLIPVFILGVLQMRAFSFKGALAILLGIATPFWAFMGLGIINYNDFVLPTITVFFENKEWQSITLLAISVGGLILIGIILLAINMLHIFNYKLQLRSYNGFFTLLFLLMVAMIVIDYNNMLVYIPLLVCCVSIQIGHSFSIFTYRRRYIPLLLVMIAYISLYITRISL